MEAKSDVEEFKVCPVNKELLVSNYGNVKNKSTGELLEKKVYIHHHVVDDPQKEGAIEHVHRLVAFTWVANGFCHKGQDVHHINGDNFNNRADNLEWLDRETHAKIHKCQIVINIDGEIAWDFPNQRNQGWMELLADVEIDDLISR